MIQKQDLILLLTDIQEQGTNVDSYLNKVLSSSDIPIDVLKFINDTRSLDVTEFYKHIRHTYNQKKSKLYKNIVSEIDDPQDTLTTLASFALQVLLYSDKLDNRQMFLKHARLEEVEKCLLHYSKTYDLIPCTKLIKLLKADVKALESIYR